MNVGRVRQLVRKELRQLFRDPKSKRIVFIAPVIQLVMFGYAVNTDVRDAPLYVVDHDRTQSSRELTAALTATGHFRIAGRSDRPGDLLDALDAGRATAGLEIPPGFAADLAAGRGAEVQLLFDGTSSNTATVAQGYATRMVRAFGARAAVQRSSAIPVATNAGGRPESRGGVELRARAWYNPTLESRVYNVPAVIATILLMMSLLLTALSVVRERELGTLEQLLVSPLTPGELMVGKTVPVAGVAFVQLALITTVALLWFDIPFTGSVALLLLGATIYILAALAFGLLISTVSRTQQEAFMLMFLFFLPAVILSGFLYPVDTMPELFQRITVVNPLRHFLEIVRGIFLKDAGLGALWVQFGSLFATAIVALGLANWRFRRVMR